MAETTLQQALDGAEYVKFHENGFVDVFVAWHGGTTFNVYRHHDGVVENVDVFTVSDDKGRPLDCESAKQAVNDHLDRM